MGTWDEMAQFITDSDGRALRFTIERGDSVIDIAVTPELSATQNLFGEDVERYMIGVTNGGDYIARDIVFGGAFLESVRYTYRLTELTVISIVKLIRGTISRKTLGGPIMIAQMAGEQVREGMESFLFFIALLSVNLAIINFAPIPVLDGGHLFLFYHRGGCQAPPEHPDAGGGTADRHIHPAFFNDLCFLQ